VTGQARSPKEAEQYYRLMKITEIGALLKADHTVSRRRIGRLMGELGIQSKYADRGSEFKNVGIDELLSKYQIERSLSHIGSPYDNAVAESTFKILKTELINGAHFHTLHQLDLELFDYVNWYNNIRSHSTIGYLSPVGYRNLSLKKIV
jgi:transposase InsO family protein